MRSLCATALGAVHHFAKWRAKCVCAGGSLKINLPPISYIFISLKSELLCVLVSVETILQSESFTSQLLQADGHLQSSKSTMGSTL